MADLKLGTSGWSYAEWIGPVYIDDKERKLTKYCSTFSTAEIDSTFYAYPSKGTVLGLNRYSPPGFAFSAKLPRVITHEKQLGTKGDVEDDLYKFLQLMEPLSTSNKLACILVQLPPSLKFDPRILEGFLVLLPKDVPFAVEFRHLSWLRDETWRMLTSYNTAYTVVDEPLLPPDLRTTSDVSYFRWHGHGRRPWYNYRYTGDELKPWVAKIREAERSTKRVLGYFNNHYHGYAVENCLQILQILGKLSEPQERALERVQKWLRDHPPGARPKAGMRKLPLPSHGTQTGLLDSYLSKFADRARIERAKTIADDEIKILEHSNDRIAAKIRDYEIVVNLGDRRILHDCPDWARESRDKKFCKHVARLFYELPEREAVDIVKRISSETDRWEFDSILARRRPSKGQDPSSEHVSH